MNKLDIIKYWLGIYNEINRELALCRHGFYDNLCLKNDNMTAGMLEYYKNLYISPMYLSPSLRAHFEVI